MGSKSKLCLRNRRTFMGQVLLVLLFAVDSNCAQRFSENSYYPPDNYLNEQQSLVNAAIDKLEHVPQWVPEWPNPSIEMGQVSGVALDNSGRVLVFHRSSNTWGQETFNSRNVYQKIGDPPIPEATILIFNDTGELVDSWGEKLFYMPHGITVDSGDNVWVTDVALHQVLKFTPENRLRPNMTLGEKFVPGDDDSHFCKPTAVAVLSDGDFFVADGYCNSRIIKYAADGTRILQLGRRLGLSPFALKVPHALTLAEDRGALCVADREHGRASCFRTDNGTHISSYHSWLIGSRLFSIAYSPAKGGVLYVVNGPYGGVPVRGFVLEYSSGRLIGTFAAGAQLSNPHDVVVSRDGSAVYVAQLDPHFVHKFVDPGLRAEHNSTTTSEAPPPADPSVTVEHMVMVGTAPWWGAAGGLLVLGGALLLWRAYAKGGAGVRRGWERGGAEFKLRRLLERRRFVRVRSEDSDEGGGARA